MPHIVELRRLNQCRGRLRDEFVTAYSNHTVELIPFQHIMLYLSRYVTGRPIQSRGAGHIHHEGAWMREFPDRGIARHHAEQRGVCATDAMWIGREKMQRWTQPTCVFDRHSYLNAI